MGSWLGQKRPFLNGLPEADIGALAAKAHFVRTAVTRADRSERLLS